MQTFIVLLRGINVGGNNLIPMKPFVALLEKEGFESVSYYIQSGNIVLTSEIQPCSSIKKIISDNYGFIPSVFALNSVNFTSAVNNNPYKDFEGKFVHFYFCTKPIKLNVEKVKQWISSTEKYFIEENVFYLYAPEGIGRSKIVANIEVCTGQNSTGRNLNTINKISNLLL